MPAETGSGGQPAQKGQEVWRLDPEAAGKVKLLEWGGLARATASWQKRWVYLHRGHLYSLEQRSSTEELASYNIWLNRSGIRLWQPILAGPVRQMHATTLLCGSASLVIIFIEAMHWLACIADDGLDQF